jgi:uncharacterized protein
VDASKQLLGDPLFDLLETGAEEARRSIRLLTGVLERGAGDLNTLAIVRDQSQRIASEIEAKLARTCMASLRKEDIEAVSRALTRIPESVERFTERLQLAGSPRPDLDFTGIGALIGKGLDALVGLVGQLRWYERTARAQALNTQAQDAADAAENLIEALVKQSHLGGRDPLQQMLAGDLFKGLQGVIDSTREAAQIVYGVVLKYG